MDDDQRHGVRCVLVASPQRRARTGLRALLEAAGIPVLDIASLDADDVAQGLEIAAVVLDLTEDVVVPPALTRPGAPPVIGVVKGPISTTPSPHLAAAVQFDDGPDAIIDAVRLAASRPPR